MAKVKGPLHSDSAHGKFGRGGVIYRTTNNFSQVYHISPVPRWKAPTAREKRKRALMLQEMKRWSTLIAADKQKWSEWKDQRFFPLRKKLTHENVSGYYLFLACNVARLIAGKTAVNYPAQLWGL